MIYEGVLPMLCSIHSRHTPLEQHLDESHPMFVNVNELRRAEAEKRRQEERRKEVERRIILDPECEWYLPDCSNECESKEKSKEKPFIPLTVHISTMNSSNVPPFVAATVGMNVEALVCECCKRFVNDPYEMRKEKKIEKMR